MYSCIFFICRIAIAKNAVPQFVVGRPLAAQAAALVAYESWCEGKQALYAYKHVTTCRCIQSFTTYTLYVGATICAHVRVKICFTDMHRLSHMDT